MLLSDRDIRAEVAAGRLAVQPWDDGLVQPSSVDVRLDRFFRVFNNSQYTHIDPAQRQDDLTSLVEPSGDDPFVLHPGEFVLGSTLEIVTLPDDHARRDWPWPPAGRLGLFRLSTAAEHPYGSAVYGSRYQGQRGPTPSRSYQSFRRWPTG